MSIEIVHHDGHLFAACIPRVEKVGDFKRPILPGWMFSRRGLPKPGERLGKLKILAVPLQSYAPSTCFLRLVDALGRWRYSSPFCERSGLWWYLDTRSAGKHGYRK